MPNNRRQRRTCYALCHILYPVSAAHTSIFRMDSNSTSYETPATVCRLGSRGRAKLSSWWEVQALSCRPSSDIHQQCYVNYREIRRAPLWSYEFHRRIDGRVPPAEGTRPYEKLPIPTDLAIAHITLLVVRRRWCGSGVYGRRRGGRALPTGRPESWRRTRKP